MADEDAPAGDGLPADEGLPAAGEDAPAGQAGVAVEAVFREERGLLLASLVRRFGDLDLAEEVTSEAIEAALRHWPAEGVPARPGAWLLTTARRR
ncbi:sigma factor, partial [Streptomyces baarnensis]